MGLFSRKTPVNSNGMTDAQMHASIRSTLERRESTADEARRAARQDEAKWDRVVRNMTSRGEDHEGRDLAIRNREGARNRARDAEIDLLTAKNERSNYRL